jgi:hypothetical protein
MNFRWPGSSGSRIGTGGVRRTDLQCSLEKVDERPLRPGAERLMLGQWNR